MRNFVCVSICIYSLPVSSDATLPSNHLTAILLLGRLIDHFDHAIVGCVNSCLCLLGAEMKCSRVTKISL